MEFIVKDPFTQETLKTYRAFSDDKIKLLLNQAEASFGTWKNLGGHKRGLFLSHVEKLITQKREELAKAVTHEVGKRYGESLAEVDKCCVMIQHFVQKGDEYLAPLTIKADGKKHEVHHEPLGVVLSIMPWNFPLWQALRFAIPALFAGNTILLKPAPETPWSSEILEQIFIQAWNERGSELKVPAHVFQLCLAGVEQIEKIIASPKVRGVSFTGSTSAGKKVAALAGAYMKKAVLELGGSDPFLVLPDARLEKIFPKAAEARMINCGQSCIAAKRFIVPKNLAQDFTQRLKEHFYSYVPGNPFDARTTLAPLFAPRGGHALMELILDATQKGANLVCGGKMLGDKAQFFSPAILTDIKASMRVFSEETFGPLALVLTYDTLEEAIQLANATPFGLGASVWGENAQTCTDVARKIECGSVFINAVVKSDARVPFGGVKESGVGKELGPLGILEFTNAKSYNYY